MFNYIFKMVSISDYESTDKLLSSMIKANSIPEEVKTVLTKSIKNLNFFKKTYKKENNKLIKTSTWNDHHHQIIINEIKNKKQTQYEIQINPIPKPKNLLILGTDIKYHIPKNAVIPITDPVENIETNILLHAQKIYNKPNENYFSFDKNGNVNFYSYGNKLTAPQHIPFGLVNRTYEIHNHPQQKEHAINIFSSGDILAFLEEPNLKQSYLVGITGILFILTKTKPIKLTKSMETHILKDFDDENIGNLAIDIYNKKYAEANRKKPYKEQVYKLELTKYEAFAKLIKKYGLKFIISHI